MMLDLTGSLSALTATSIAFEKGTSHWEDSEEIVKTYLLLGATHALMGDMKNATDASLKRSS